MLALDFHDCPQNITLERSFSDYKIKIEHVEVEHEINALLVQLRIIFQIFE